MELIISSISPTKYLFAKLLSTLFVGLTQVAVWLLVPYLLYKLNIINIDDSLSSFINFSNLDTEMIGLGIIFLCTWIFTLRFFSLFIWLLNEQIRGVLSSSDAINDTITNRVLYRNLRII